MYLMTFVQQRLRSGCISTQCDQNFYWALWIANGLLRTICTKYQNLFSEKKKKNHNLLSASGKS